MGRYGADVGILGVPERLVQDDGGVAIGTPDRRLRVFVSSTPGELAEERRAAARAITALHLSPVMLETGARPHPPRDLYRAYLEQSDVFVGIYWQRYGQLGPEMTVSGVEEEFDLARGMPRLLYVKAPAPDREPRLTALLARVRQEASYRHFRTATELGRLIRDDLALLLSERFAAASEAPGTQAPAPLPVGATSLLGRERDIEEIPDLLAPPDGRLVTLTGPGGIGKTRLALAVAERLQGRFGAGIAFVPLAAVSRPDQVLPSIARAVGADLTGNAPPLEALAERLGDGRWLLVIDNFEHVVEAARDLNDLLSRCPGVVVLATSRTVLRLRAEREYPVSPLPLPDDAADAPVDELASVPAVALFVDRARAVRHDFALSEANAGAVVEICRRLEGLPLAIELAAARTRLLEPAALLDRLSRSLDTLGAGPVDMPERQHTLRATVAWSVGLLDADERSLLEALAAFVDGWTLDAASQVAGLDENRALELTEALARHSLVEMDGRLPSPRSRMLETVRAFVAERLAARADVAYVQRRHADYYRTLAEQADRRLRTVGHRDGLERLEVESGNLAAAARWYLAHDTRPLPHLLRVLWLFWELRDRMGDTRAWVEQLMPTADSLDVQPRAELLWTAAVTALEVGDDDASLATTRRLASLLADIDDPHLHAVAQLAIAWSSPIVGDFDGALAGALAARRQLSGQEEPYWTALSGLTAGYLELALGHLDDAERRMAEGRALAERYGYAWLGAWARVLFGTLAIVRGRLDEARALLDEGLALSLAAHSTRNVSLCLTAFAQLALAAGQPERGALLAGAADGLRRRVGLRPWPMLRRGEANLLDQLRDALGPDGFDAAFAAGTELRQQEAVAATVALRP